MEPPKHALTYSMTIEGEVDGLNVTAFHSISGGVDYIILNCLHTASSAIALNPEKILKAKADKETRKILEGADFLYPDGMGIVKVLERKTHLDIARIPGCDLWEQLMERAGRENIPVFLIGARPEILLTTVTKLQNDYSTPIAGYNDGYFTNEKKVIEKIKGSGAKIISVALGSPRQERFISKCIASGVEGFFMGVGGSFDVYTGNVKRAPKFLCDHNLEWSYRLVTQPSRLFRQIKLIKFVWLYITRQL